MKTYSQSDVARLNWGGLKPIATSVMGLPLVNPVLRAILAKAPPRWQARLPLRLPYVTYYLSNGTAIRQVDPSRDLVARDIYWGSGKLTSAADARALRLVERLCAEPVTFVDIGSYGALFSVVATASNPETTAIAFEIVPENYKRMIDNILANDCLARVDARLVALGAETATLTMPVDLGLSSSATSMSLGSVFQEGATIPVRRLDSELPADDGRPLVMKLDVEGFEADVLAGAPLTLAERRPTMICEVLGGSTRHAEIEAALTPHGYRFALITDDGFEQREHIEPVRGFRDYVLYASADVEPVLDQTTL